MTSRLKSFSTPPAFPRRGKLVSALGLSDRPAGGKQFSDYSSARIFEQRLGARVETTPQGQVYVAGKSGPARYEIPLDRLDATVAHGVELIFTPMPDFGPGGDF
jgi:hypothetical protein